MFVLGHVGITAAAAALSGRRVDLRLAALMAMLPDIVDKPARLLLPELVNRNTRGFGHTLLGAAVVLAALLALRKRVAAPLLLWGCFAGHLVLDRMWLNDDPKVLLWPLRGDFPPPIEDRETSRPLWHYNLAGEAVGLLLIAALVR